MSGFLVGRGQEEWMAGPVCVLGPPRQIANQRLGGRHVVTGQTAAAIMLTLAAIVSCFSRDFRDPLRPDQGDLCSRGP